MHTTRFKQIALATFFVAGWVALFGVAVGHAQPQGLPLPPPPAPVFNPSSPNTVPQSPETPVSPGTGTPSAPPGVFSPSDGSSLGAASHSHRRAVTPTAETPDAGNARGGQHTIGHHGRSRSRGSAWSYRLPIGYDGPYCVWRRDWTGYWAPACSWGGSSVLGWLK